MSDIVEKLRERLKLKYIGESRFDEDVALVPIADIAEAADEINRLREDVTTLHNGVNTAEQDNVRLRAEKAELVAWLELILPLAKGYNAIQSGAPSGCPESNLRYVEHADAALSRARAENTGGESDG